MELDYSLIGIVLLAIGLVAIVIEFALAAFWSFRISRHARTLSERLASEQGRLQSDVSRLRLAMAETEALWRPYRRLLRWVRHPLAIALLQSFIRRRATAR